MVGKGVIEQVGLGVRNASRNGADQFGTDQSHIRWHLELDRVVALLQGADVRTRPGQGIAAHDRRRVCGYIAQNRVVGERYGSVPCQHTGEVP